MPCSGSKENRQAKGAYILQGQQIFKAVNFRDHSHPREDCHDSPDLTMMAGSAHSRNISYFLFLKTLPIIYSMHAFLAGVQTLSAKDNMNDAFNKCKA